MDEDVKIIHDDAEDESGNARNIVGNVRISADVVSTIAGIAAEEIEGVAGMYTGFAVELAEKLGARKNPARGVRINMSEDSVAVDLYIIITFGARIPEVSWKVQENVKNNIETMTGLTVTAVNLHIEGISFDDAGNADEDGDVPEPVIEIDPDVPGEDGITDADSEILD